MNSRKRIRIELEDNTGGKYNLSIEGNLSKEKIIQAIELMDLVNENTSNDISFNSLNNISNSKNLQEESIDSKIWNIITKSFSNTKFTSTDIANFYQEKYNDPIKLSVISTYLSRYCNKGKLIRNKKLREYVYHLQNSNLFKQHLNHDQLSSTSDSNNDAYSYNLTKKRTIHDLQN